MTIEAATAVAITPDSMITEGSDKDTSARTREEIYQQARQDDFGRLSLGGLTLSESAAVASNADVCKRSALSKILRVNRKSRTNP